MAKEENKNENKKDLRIPRPNNNAESQHNEMPKGNEMTRDQLMQMASQYAADNKQLRAMIKQAEVQLNMLRKQLEQYQMQDYYQRLEWLWKVMHDKDGIFPKDFVEAKVEEFIEMMTPMQPETPDMKESDDSKKED